MFKSAKIFAARLSEVEKCVIRTAGSNEDRLDYLFYAHHRYEFDAKVVAARKLFLEAVDLVNEEFRQKSNTNTFGLTWKF